ncbi:MAG: 30S ribosomal protein S6 [Deltaproteobacteria bacterium]|nr:30S ribosomal protein S6 [Deltaproteobacteria bacterium]
MSRVALAPQCAREYETVYIMRPTVDKETADGLAARLVDAVKAQGGRPTELELWGRRRLAYSIERHHRGIYVYLKYLGRGQAVSEIERQLRLADSVLRYQTVRVRDDVPTEEPAAPGAEPVLGFELPAEPEEPALSREQQLGLDGALRDRGHGRPPRDEARVEEGGEEDEEGAEGGGEPFGASDDGEKGGEEA